MGIENEYVKKSEVLDQIDQWIDSGEYCYSNAIHYLKKRVSEIRDDSWVSVADRLPEKDGSYLIAMYHRLMVGGIYKTYTARFVASFNAEYKEWTVMGEVCTTVTHWMNLPDFPEE